MRMEASLWITVIMVHLLSLIAEPVIANSDCLTDQQFYGLPTNLKGDREGIISSRHQEHLWITDDGVFHALINNGNKQNALELFSSVNGSDWRLQLTFTNTDHRSHPDGFLKEGILWIVYPSSDDQIFLHKLSYAFETKSWSKAEGIKVYQQFGYAPDRPTIAVDQDQIWIAFSELNQKTRQTLIKVIKATNGARGLNCCELEPTAFATANDSKKKSARILILKDKIALIYTDETYKNSTEIDEKYGYRLNWAYLPLPYHDSEWITAGELFKYKSDENDPHGTHFNVAKDSFDNMHIVTRSEREIIYLSVKNSYPIQINQAHSITNESSPPYMQISVSENNEIYVVYPARCTNDRKLHVGVLKSLDLGENFFKIATLHIDPESNPENPRIETPSQFRKTLPILWQIRKKNGKYTMMFFQM